MGKSKPRTRTKGRVDPISKPVKPLTDPELVALRDARILPVINNLASADVKKRTEAALAIANLVEDKRCRKLLLREQIVHILLEQTITDSALESKSAGWGILRNLAQEEEADFCIHLYRQDVLTPLYSMMHLLLETIESESQPVTKLPKLQIQLVWTLCGSIIGLTTSLANAQEEVLDASAKCPSLLPLLFALLKLDITPAEQIMDALLCLTTLTEDNKLTSHMIVQKAEWLEGLMQMRSDRNKVTVCGVLHNIFDALQWYDHNTPIAHASDSSLLPYVLGCLDDSSEDSQTNGDSHSHRAEVLHVALALLASIATTLQEALAHESKNEKEFEGFEDAEPETKDALEPGAMNEDFDKDEGSEGENDNVGGDDDDDENDDDNDDDDEMTLEQIDADMALVAGTEAEAEERVDDREGLTLKLLIHDAIPKILPLASVKAGMNGDVNIQHDALSALNNIAWTMSSIHTTTLSIVKSWSARAQQIWTEIVSPVLASDTSDILFASLVTSLAWALLRSSIVEIHIQDNEPRKFMALYQASKSLEDEEESPADPFHSIGVKAIGVLGSFAGRAASVSLNREIGSFLVTVLSTLPDVPVVDCIEALNQIYDIYADEASEHAEAVFWKDGFLKQLESLKPKVRSAVKTVDKRKNAEVRMRADEALLNLDRFLAYKRRTRRSSRAD